MLKIYQLLICFILGFYAVNAQNITYEKMFRFKKGSQKINAIDVTGDQRNNRMSVLLSANSDHTLLTLDSNFQDISEIRLENPNMRFERINGFTEKDGKYYVYFYNANTQTLLAQVFDPEFKHGYVQERLLNFEKRERFLNSFSIGETLYILTLFEQSSKLSIYEFSGQESLKKTVIELDNASFPHYLSDNLYNCISHDPLRSIDANLVADFVFADKEDYIIYQNDALYIISNTNTVVHINLESKTHQVYQFPIDFKYEKKSLFLFKNLVKNTSIRSTIVDHKYFRVAEYESILTLQIFDLNTGTKTFDQSFTSSEMLDSYISSDYRKEDQWNKEEVIENLMKGPLAFRVYKDQNIYKINIGRNIDRLFELYYGYVEWEIDSLKESNFTYRSTTKGDYHHIREARQNLNYEFFEKLYRKKNDNLYLIQYDTKQRKLIVLD